MITISNKLSADDIIQIVGNCKNESCEVCDNCPLDKDRLHQFAGENVGSRLEQLANE